MIVHNKPYCAQGDAEVIATVLNSGWIAQGQGVQDFEGEFCDFMNGGGACACSSGTAGLYLALLSLGMGEGKRVALPSYACTALLNAVNLTGATPVLCDVDLDTFCLNPKQVPCADSVIAVHSYGSMADVDGFRDKGMTVIEDCCHSLGGFFAGDPIGSKADVAVFSFYATKIITCGHGGLVWSKSSDAGEFCRDYRDFDGRDSYKPRFNFHMSDIQAAMVSNQFKDLESIRARRAVIASRYAQCLEGKVSHQRFGNNSEAMYYRFVVLLESENERDALLAKLKQAGIGSAIPVEKWELLHRYLNLNPSDYPNAERIAETSLSLPVYPLLTDEEISCVCSVLTKHF